MITLREKLVKGTEKECIQFSKDMSDLGKIYLTFK